MTLQQIGRYRLTSRRIQIAGLSMFPIGVLLAGILCWLHLLIDPPNSGTIHIRLLPLSLWWLAGTLVLIPIHEALHGLAALVAGVRPKRITFGFKLRGLVPYCHVDGDTSVTQTRLVFAAPLVVTGLAGAAGILATGSLLAVLLLPTAISMSGGDILLLWFLRRFHGEDICGEGEDLFEAVISRPSADD